MACGREAVLDSLLAGLNQPGTCETIVDQDGLPLAMYGSTSGGCVWLLGSDELLKHRREFLRRSKEIINDLHVRYGKLWNAVWAGNTEHIRWLEWCGFTVHRPPFYFNKQPFLSFHKDV